MTAWRRHRPHGLCQPQRFFGCNACCDIVWRRGSPHRIAGLSGFCFKRRLCRTLGSILAPPTRWRPSRNLTVPSVSPVSVPARCSARCCASGCSRTRPARHLRHAAGPDGVAAYLDDPLESRLILSMKTYLSQRSFSETRIFWPPVHIADADRDLPARLGRCLRFYACGGPGHHRPAGPVCRGISR